MRTTAWKWRVAAAVAMAWGSTAGAAPRGPAAATDAIDGSGNQASWSAWQGRLSLGSSLATWQIGTPLASDVRRSASLMGDYYFGRSLAGIGSVGGFRATSGLIFGPRGLLATGQPTFAAGSGLSLGSALPVASRTLAVNDSGGDFATLPYLGLGYTGLSARSHWSFSADLGWVAQSPGGALRLGRGGAGASLDDLVRELRVTPLFQLGVSYAF